MAVIWDTKNRKEWYIGFFLDKNDDGTFRIDHLERDGKTNSKWIRPRGRDDIQDTEEVQVLPIDIVGDWVFTGDRPTFLLDNTEQIHNTFNLVSKELLL